MEVVPMTLPKSNSSNGSVGLPFNRRNVEEWSKLDRLTGIMETAKIETNHWAAKTLNATHNYGKVVDARERNNADGSLQERQRKQMEVFQTKVAGGSMQVIRTQTITTSSKKWSSMTNKIFDDLALPINSLDLSSQKTKGSVGRSGSIGGRRPPTRPRSLISQSSVGDSIFEKESSAFRLSHHFNQQSDFFHKDIPEKPRDENSDKESESSGVVITDVTNEYSPGENCPKTGLSRQKSCSNENLNDDDSLLKRYSKVRRSLQWHKQSQCQKENDLTDDHDSTPTKSLKERAAEIEKLLRRGNTNQFSPVFDKLPEVYGKVKFQETKDAFVSAETLKEVRERLKKPHSRDVSESKDDGIVTEKNDFANTDESYYKKPAINGTGSLESRYSNKSSSHASRTSEWYRRRKSYGFEQVDEYGKFDKINGKKKNYLDSSTDSGICQSSETMGVPIWTKNSDSVWTKVGSYLTPKKTDIQSNVVTVKVKEDSSVDLFNDKKINSIYLNGNEDPFPIKKEEKIKNSFYKYDRDLSPSKTVWNQKSPIPFQKNNETFKSSLKSTKNPWLSQLRGTKLVDRDWASDEWTTLDDTKCDALHYKPTAINDKKEDLNEDFGNLKRNKKVEFCKTEVHFAAESGKFNIVETDGKPPPNDFYRRRRKSAMGGGSATKDTNGLPEIKFGDSLLEKNMVKKTEKVESISEKIEAELNELSKIVIEALPRTEKHADNFEGYKCKNSLLYNVAEETNVNNKDTDLTKPRSILKNCGNPFELDEIQKPKESNYIELPQKSEVPVWQSTVVLRNKRFDDVKRNNDDNNRKLYSSDGESELQIRIRNLRKTDPEQGKKFWDATSFEGVPNWRSDSKRRSLPDDAFLRVKYHNGTSSNKGVQPHDDSVSPEETYTLSVAERIKKVEQLKLNNYSTKINFRSGEMTIVQNGTSNASETTNEDKNKTMTSWENQRKMENLKKSKNEEKTNEKDQQHVPPSDDPLNGNRPITRFSTYADKADKQKYQTTRILINFKTSLNKNEKTNEPAINEAVQPSDMLNNGIDNCNSISINSSGSWPSGSTKKDLTKYLNELKSANIVRETIHPVQSNNSEPVQSHQQQRENIPKPSKTVHEIIDQFDSLSRSTLKDKRRKSILTKPSKEYTHSDLEEELKNFTENLDKDFRDIYEEEIGTFRKSKSLRETRTKNQTVTPRVENFVRPINIRSSYSEPSSTKPSRKPISRTLSKTNYDSDDSDLLADEEVRSYMSTGHGGSDSEPENSDTRKTFQNSIFRFKKMETETNEKKDIKYDSKRCDLHNSPAHPKSNLMENFQKINKAREKSPKRTSIVLKCEDHSQISKPVYQNLKSLKLDSLKEANPGFNKVNTKSWKETTDLNSTPTNTSKPRERVSYLNGLSLSEKYSNYLQRSSDSSVDMVSDIRRNSYENFLSTSDDDFSRKNKNDISKSKMTTSGYLKQCSTEENDSKNQKKENYPGEKPTRGKYVPKAESQEESRRQIKANSDKSSGQKSKSDKYQIKENGGRLESVKRERNQTDGDLEEMKKAAEEIILAVNNFTDDSSHTGTSEDEKSRRIIRKDQIGNLGTISEGKRASKTETKKTISLHSHGRITGNQSSASSTESLNKESYRSIRESKAFARHKHGGSGTGICSRPSRSLHRVTKEAATGQRSSSEEIPSCVEQVKRRVVRRQKNGVSNKPEVTSEPKKIYSRHRSKSRGKESPPASMKKNSKQNKLKESSSISKSSRSSQILNDDKTKLASPRKIATNKPDVEVDSNKKRRSQRIASKEEHLPLDKAYKKKVSSSKTEASKLRQVTR